MKFIITLIKVAIVAFLATSIFYLFEYKNMKENRIFSLL